MPILRGRPSQRPERFALNTGSPLARGLLFAGLGQHAGGTLFHDESPAKMHGTLTNYTGSGNTPSSRWSRNIGRASLYLSRVNNNLISVTSQPVVSRKTSWTLCAWIKPAGASDVGGGLGIWNERANTGNDIVKLDYGVNTSSSLYLTMRDDAGTLIQSTNSISLNDGNWHFVAITRKASQIYLYTDFAAPYSVSWGGTSNFTDSIYTNIGSGWYLNSDYNFDGNLADPLAWERDLSPSELYSLADPSNVDLRIGGVPLIQPVRRFWPVGPAAAGEAPTFKPAWAVNSNIVIG
jgi:hypothetical protein